MPLAKASRYRVQDKILSILEEGPSYGYEMIRQLGEEYGDLRLNTLYRWLADMEENSLIRSNRNPGPYGPDRRIYNIAPDGRKHVRFLLRDSIRLVLNLYDEYRLFLIQNLSEVLQHLSSGFLDGRKLFAFGSRMTTRDLLILEYVIEQNGSNMTYTIGDLCLVDEKDYQLHSLGGSLLNIPSRSNSFTEIWITELPDREFWLQAFSECKRVLKKGGKLWILPAFAYLVPPFQHSLEDFMRITSVHLFPDLGVIEAESLCQEMQVCFPESGGQEIATGMTVFWAIKSD